MIEAFTAYIKTITALTLFSVLAGLLMPEGSFRKYLEMVLGIMLLAAVIQPLFHLGEAEFSKIKIFEEEGLPQEEDYAVMQEKWLQEAYTKELEEGILADLQNQYSAVEWVCATWEEDMEKDTYGSLQKLIIGGSQVTEEVRRFAAERYELPLSKVQVRTVTKDGE